MHMGGVWQTVWQQGDGISRSVALLLLTMSVASWVVILWKSWLLRRAGPGLSQAVRLFWAAPDLAQARQALARSDRLRLVSPLVLAVQTLPPAGDGSLAAAGDRSQQLTRVLRDALHGVLRRLQYGQVLLATVGSTAPFVGLLGTVWGIYHALTEIGADGQFRIEQVSGPVGEALVMTAAGLAVAIPAVLAYNVLGRRVADLEADLEGFARDLRELLASRQGDL